MRRRGKSSSDGSDLYQCDACNSKCVLMNRQCDGTWPTGDFKGIDRDRQVAFYKLANKSNDLKKNIIRRSWTYEEDQESSSPTSSPEAFVDPIGLAQVKVRWGQNQNGGAYQHHSILTPFASCPGKLLEKESVCSCVRYYGLKFRER